MTGSIKKVGIIGSGSVATVLGAAFVAEGYSVMLGSRNSDKDELLRWQSQNDGSKLGTFSESASFGDIIVLATKGSAIIEAVAMAGVKNFTGKVVIDATNPIADAPPVNGVLQFFTGPNESLLEKIQQLLPGAHLVKAFNSIGNLVFYKPQYTEGTPTMFICGNSDEAKKTVADITSAFGFDAEDMGTAEAARAIEPLCMLWCILGFTKNQWTHAFKLLKK